MKKEIGVLCHVTCLPNKYGVGDFGKCCFDFVDFLSENKIDIWQMLPLNNTNKHNCPYGAISSLTFDEMFVDLEDLLNNGYLKKTELKQLLKLKNSKFVNYDFVKKEKLKLFEQAYNNLSQTDFVAVDNYAKKNKIIFKYGYYRVLLNNFGTEDWHTVPKILWNLTSADGKEFVNKHKLEILKHVFFQKVLATQWEKVKNYANSKNIKILGDLPIYVERTSFDVFENPQYFKLDKNLNPKVFGGVPPDDFCADGQNWGTCIWNWKEIEKNNFEYIIQRIKTSLNHFDMLRLDHYSGYVEHYEIDAKNCSQGRWIKEGGSKFFAQLKKSVNLKNIVIEDLGITTCEGAKVKKEYSLKGMNILQFAFNGKFDNKYLPNNVEKNSIYFLGTHDNNTFIGFLREQKDKKKLIKQMLNTKTSSNKKLLYLCTRKMLNSASETIILQIQDFLCQNEKYRINTPGRAGGCFEYRMPNNFKKQFLKTLKNITKTESV